MLLYANNGKLILVLQSEGTSSVYIDASVITDGNWHYITLQPKWNYR